MADKLDQEGLYHNYFSALGEVAMVATKPFADQHALSLAYTPGLGVGPMLVRIVKLFISLRKPLPSRAFLICHPRQSSKRKSSRTRTPKIGVTRWHAGTL